MKAIILKDFGGTENLALTELPMPTIQNNEVLVKLKAISINPVDVKTRAGRGVAGTIKDQMPAVIGWDFSGVVTEVGSEVDNFKPGDEVFAMISFPKLGKTYAEYVAAPASELALKPGTVSHEHAAATTLAALTAWQALTVHSNVKQGDKVLIHAASGGVGHFAVQLAKHLGAYVIGTSSVENKDFVLSIGADEHIDYKAQPFENVAKDIDFVLDTIGDDYIDRSLTIMKKGGTIVSIVSGKNESVSEKAGAMGLHGKVMRVHASGEDMKTMAGFLERGIITPHIHETFPFEKMAEAHAQIESGRTVGRVALVF